jgi:hypothetical protein
MFAARSILHWLWLMAAWPSWGGQVVITNREVRLDDQRFIMRGVCYNPTPAGQDGRRPPHGDYFTGDWRAVYRRDLPRMREMGVNCVRVYGWSATADHTEFLDLAWNGGKQPIHVLIGRWIDPYTDWRSVPAVAALKAEWAAVVQRARDHPATLGYMVGNELNQAPGNRSLPQLWPALNEIAGEIRRHDTNHLVTTALSDHELVSHLRAAERFGTNFNVLGVQVYRGAGFKGLFEEFAAASRKPLFVTEFGMDAFNARYGREFMENAQLPADVVTALWKELVKNSAIASGGAVFSWCDEWWKHGRAASHDPGGWPNGAFPDGQADEEWWGLHRVHSGNPDVLEPRAAFEALKKLWKPSTP